MATKQRVRGGVAALACLAILAGYNLGTADDTQDRDPEKTEQAAKVARSIVAADEMIQFGVDNEMPTAVIAGVEVLSKIYSQGNPDTQRVKFEGDKSPDQKEEMKAETKRLKSLLATARGMPLAKSNTTIQSYAEMVEGKLGEDPRGTASGHTRTPLHVKAGSPESFRLQFYTGKTTILVTKTANVGVPIKVTVTDPSGAVVAPLGSNPLSYDFRVPKLGYYKITVAVTQGTKPCDVLVTTN